MEVLQNIVKEYTIFLPRATFFRHFSIFSLERVPAESLALDRSFLFLAFFPILVCLLQLMAIFSNKSNKARQTSLDASQALSVVFTPTSVAWPTAFISHFRSAKTNGRHLELSLYELFDHIFQGRIEMRDYHDLPDLFRGLRAYGRRIKFGLDARWYFKTAKWLVAQHIFSTRSDLPEGRNGNPLMVCLQSISIDLDVVPYRDLETALRRIQAPYQAGSLITIEFSCLASDIAFMSTQFILCAIPLLPRAFGSRTKRNPRTSMLLLTRLETIVMLLLSLSCRIVCVDNVSYRQATILQTLETELASNKNKRVDCINNFGIAGWREERFMVAWEAALLISGKLVRWKIILKKPQKLQ